MAIQNYSETIPTEQNILNQNKFNNIFDDIGRKAKKLARKIKRRAKDAARRAKKAAEKIKKDVNKVTKKVGKDIKKAANDAKEFANKGLDKINATMNGFCKPFTKILNQVIDAIEDTFPKECSEEEIARFRRSGRPAG